jgi:hypothetical protein
MKVWKKIALHTHTFWSDGKGTPEQMIAAFKADGFDAVAWTDHNYFPDGEEELYLPVMPEEGAWPGSLSEEVYADYKSHFACYEKRIAFRTLVRIRNYPEIKKEMEESGRFLLLPGGEFTSPIDTTGTARELHINYVNLGRTFPFREGEGTLQTITMNKEQFDRENKGNSLFMVNHPLWRFYNVDPMTFVDLPSLKHFEICNGGSEHTVLAEAYTPDKFFDIVNAFRLLRGHEPIFAAASDDSHCYLPRQLNGIAGVGNAFVMALVDDFSEDGITNALNRGDYYPTTGVIFDTISMQDGVMRVKIKAEKGINYKIAFLSTARDADTTIQYREIPGAHNHPPRKIPFFAEDFGRIVKMVEGAEGACQIGRNDLYLRAMVLSDKPTTMRRAYFPEFQCAWTQIMKAD